MRYQLRYHDQFEYEATVKRTYQDGVFVQRDIFSSLHKAQIWLEFTFDEQLAKHFDRLGTKSEKKQ